jgi:hypothetical protein
MKLRHVWLPLGSALVACSGDSPPTPEGEPHAAPLHSGAPVDEKLGLEAEVLDGGDAPLVAGCLEQYGETDVDCEAARVSFGETCSFVGRPWTLLEQNNPSECLPAFRQIYTGKAHDCRVVLNDPTAVCRKIDNVCFPGFALIRGGPRDTSSARCEFGTPAPVETTYCRCPYDHAVEKTTANACGTAAPGDECNLKGCDVKKADGTTEHRNCEWNPNGPMLGGGGGGIGGGLGDGDFGGASAAD